MNEFLTDLGVPLNVQAFFALEEPVFYFGSDHEYFSAEAHRIPATNNLWLAGNPLARQVIITFSGMEAVAFLTLNQSDYPHFNELLFLALGVRMGSAQFKWIRSNLKGRDFTLAFGNELIGRLTDIKAATAIRNKPVMMRFQEGIVNVRLKEKTISFEEDRLSLSSFEKAFAIRTMIRTCKPLNQLTFLDQLKYESSR